MTGRLCGRFRCWDEDGKLVSTSFYIMDKKVSKRKYAAACQADPTLPRYEGAESEAQTAKASVNCTKREMLALELERRQHNEFISTFLKQANRGEARQWLAGSQSRNIGEMTHEESVEFIEDGYKAGATKIIAVEIEAESTNCLIVYLPQAGPKRKRVFKWNGESAQRHGFDPYEDWGQNELFAFFS